MSVSAPSRLSTAAAAQTRAATAGAPPATDACPLCGTPLLADQDWCLRCGAAARTRLASSPNWRLPIAALTVVAALALALLAVALVKLAGGSSSSHRPAAVGLYATPTPRSGAAGAVLGGTSTPAKVAGAATGGSTSTPTKAPGAATGGATSAAPGPAGGAGRSAPGSGSTRVSPTTPVPPASRTGISPFATPGATSIRPSRAEQERLRQLLRKTR